jgi:antimicrobial peptide system SdpA family protein
MIPDYKFNYSRNAKQLIIIGLTWFAIVVYIGLASIPFNPLSLSYNQKASIFTLIPQGWGFFTRNPREDEPYIYKKAGKTWIQISKPNAASGYFFGASRQGRKINFEAYNLISQLKDSLSWQKVDLVMANPKQFADLPLVRFINNTTSPILLGEFIFVKKRKIPWAWSNYYFTQPMPSKVLHFYAAKPIEKP